MHRIRDVEFHRSRYYLWCVFSYMQQWLWNQRRVMFGFVLSSSHSILVEISLLRQRCRPRCEQDICIVQGGAWDLSCVFVCKRSTCKSPPSAQCMRGTRPFQVWATLIRPKRAGPGSASLSHPHSWPSFLTDLSIISLCANRHNNHTYLFIEVLLFLFYTRTFQSLIISLSLSSLLFSFWSFFVWFLVRHSRTLFINC